MSDSVERSGASFARLVRGRLRREARSAFRKWVPERRVGRYLNAQQIRKVQLGAGSNVLPGWLNTDRDPPRDGAYLDVARRFPLPDASFDYVFVEHVIEHLSYAKGLEMLGECFRVMRSGGRIRVATPDLGVLAALCSPRRDETQERFVHWTIDTFRTGADGYLSSFVVNYRMRAWGHKFIYDRETLERSLNGAGFVDCREFEYGVSDDRHLRGIERHGMPDNVDMAKLQTLVVEAARP